MNFGANSLNSSGTSRNQWGDAPNSSSGNKWGNTYGLSPQFLESLNINGPLTSKIFVANVSIPYEDSFLLLKMLLLSTSFLSSWITKSTKRNFVTFSD